jgi:hypothetical protein
MRNANSKWALLVLGLAVTALTYFLIGASTAQVGSSTVPAPTSTQKKVVLKNLGMA